MNIKLQLELKLKDNTKSFKFFFDTMLKPFYITEREVLTIFFDEYNHKYFKSVRELIFYNSIKADEMLGQNFTFLSAKDLLILKKKITTCLTVRDFGKKFNKDYIGSLTRSKTFADFSVSTTQRNDPRFVHGIVQEAEECIKNLEELIGPEKLLTPAIGYTFVKGALNSNNTEVMGRLWHHGNLSELSKEITAFDKKWFEGKKYKNGSREDLGHVSDSRVKD